MRVTTVLACLCRPTSSPAHPSPATCRLDQPAIDVIQVRSLSYHKRISECPDRRRSSRRGTGKGGTAMPSIDLVGGLDQAAVTVNLSLRMDISVLFLVICCIVDLVGHP